MNFVLSLTNKFFQTFSKTALTFLPVYIDRLAFEKLYDSIFILLNNDSRVFHGYVEVTDVISRKNDKMQYNKLLKIFNIPLAPDLYFIKFRDITWFVDLRYTIENCEKIFNIKINVSCPSLYDIDIFDEASDIIDGIEIAQQTFQPTPYYSTYIYAKCNPCFDLIQELESNFDKGCCREIVKHYNYCENCKKSFNTNINIENVVFPLCFTMYKNEPVIANKLIGAFNNNTPYVECGDEEIFLSTTTPNIVYLSNCNKHEDHVFFIAP